MSAPEHTSVWHDMRDEEARHRERANEEWDEYLTDNFERGDWAADYAEGI